MLRPRLFIKPSSSAVRLLASYGENEILRAALPPPTLGSHPRAAQTLTLGAKLNALLDGRFNTAFSDVQKVYLPAMRHRVLLNFEGEAEGVSTDDVLREIMQSTPTMAEAAA